MLNLTPCPDATPNFLNIIDTTIAPSLLYYSYIPIVLVSFFLSLFVLIKDKRSLLSKLLLAVTVSFSLWVVSAIVEWIAVDMEIVHFFWQIISIFEFLTFLFFFYFVYVFLNKRDLPFKYKTLLGLLFLPVILALPTKLNMLSFDVAECQANNGIIWIYIYYFEALAVFAIMDLFYRKYRSLPKGDPMRKQIAVMAPGVFLFLGMFVATNILGDFLLVYEVNLIGPVGMVIFFALMTYMIVRFGVFNIRLLAAQALVGGIFVLVASQFAFIKTPINRVLTGITLVLTAVFGWWLVRAVKKEVKQREELAKLNKDLAASIKQRAGLVHLITHKVKGSFTRSKYIFAELLEGSFGPISAKVKDIAQKGLASDNEGINTVDLVLEADNLQAGLVKYDIKPLDFKEIVGAAVANKKEQAEAKNLKVKTGLPDGACNVAGDAIWLKEVVSNLIDNAIKYSPKGEIQIDLEKKDGKILLSVKDNGIGLIDEDKKHLFQAGGRGKDSLIYNVDSTGYGLYTVKMIVEAHHGRVWAESAGRDKGSAFWVELPERK